MPEAATSPTPLQRTRNLAGAGADVGPYVLLYLALAVGGLLLAHQHEARLANLILIFAIAAVGVNVGLGYAGLVSMGHAALMAIGGYTSAILMGKLGFAFPVAFGTAIALAAMVSACLGLLATRVRPLYLLVITAGFHQVTLLVIINEGWLTGGAVGFFGVAAPDIGPWTFTNDRSAYGFIGLVFVLSLYLADRLGRSRAGRAMIAARVSEVVARASAVDVGRYHIWAMMFSGALLGASGSLFAHLAGFLGVESFSLALTLQLILAVVIGGIGSNWGAAAGTACLTVLTEELRSYTIGWVLIYGMLIMILVIVMPKGLAGLVDAGVGIVRRFLARRGITQSSPSDGA